MEADKNIHQLIVKHFSHTINPDERKMLDRWIRESADHKKLFNDLQEIWLTTGVQYNTDEYPVEEALKKFRAKMKQGKAKNIFVYSLRKHLMRYAALFILLLAIPVSFYIGRNINHDNSQTVISCEDGDRTNITLPDGTVVWLNSGSRLAFNNDFKSGIRKSYLTGEAYFSVTKDPENPFVVHTNDIDVEVLGTEFNLKSYPDENEVSATLVTGSLCVTSKTQQTTIKPNQKLIFSKQNKRMGIVKLSDLSPEIEWKNGRFIFQNESLGEMQKRLERWFDVEIEFADDQVKERRFTGTIDRESILEAIDYFGRSPFVEYRIAGNVITLYSE